MNPSFATKSAFDTRWIVCRFLLFVLVIISIIPSGCVTARSLITRNRDNLAGSPRIKNAKTAQVEEIVAHINQNTERIQNWKTNSVRIRAEGMSFSGNIAVEKGQHFRLFVNSPLGKELDLGSNSERFWVWSRRLDPAFVTCKHENIELARREFGIPFEPQWLMQALGVECLPTNGVTIEADPANEHIRLVEQFVTAHGRPLRRAVLVDMKGGRGVVVEHSLYAHNAGRIAYAKLGDHRLDKASGVVLPHRIQLEWPEHNISLAMTMGEIQVNSESIPSDLWEIPVPQNCQIVHLDENLPRDRPERGTVVTAVRPESAVVRLGPIETVTTHDESNFLRDNDSATEDHSIGRAKLSRGEFDEEQDEDVDPVKNSEDDWSR